MSDQRLGRGSVSYIVRWMLKNVYNHNNTFSWFRHERFKTEEEATEMARSLSSSHPERLYAVIRSEVIWREDEQ